DLYDPASGRLVRQFTKEDAMVGALVVNDEARVMVAGVASGSPHTLKVYDIGDRLNPREIRTFEGLFRPYASLCAAQRWIAFTSRSSSNPTHEEDTGLITIRDYQSGELIRDLPESGSKPVFSADGKILVTGSWKGTIKIWDTDTWTNHTI